MDLGTAYLAVRGDIEGLRRDLGDARRHTEMATRGMQSSANKTMAVFKKMWIAVAGASGLIYGFARLVKTGAEFEKTMAVVRGVTQATAAEFQGLTAIARHMGETTEFTASQAAEALRFLGMAGFSATQATKALPAVLDLATAGNIDLGLAADIATNAMTAMGIAIEDLGHVNDVFIATITSSNTSVEMMAESFKYAAPSAKAFGYSIEELSSFIGLLGNAGIQATMAGTQLAFIFQRLPQFFKRVGVSAKDAEGNLKKITDALRIIEEKGMDASEILEIFGQRGGKAMLVFKDLGVEAMEGYLEQIEKAEGASTRLAKIMRDTVSGGLKEIASALESVGIDIFSAKAEDLKDLFKLMAQSIRDNKQGIVDLAIAISDIIIFMGRLSAYALKLITLFDRLLTVILPTDLIMSAWRGLLDILSKVAGLVEKIIGMVSKAPAGTGAGYPVGPATGSNAMNVPTTPKQPTQPEPLSMPTTDEIDKRIKATNEFYRNQIEWINRTIDAEGTLQDTMFNDYGAKTVEMIERDKQLHNDWIEYKNQQNSEAIQTANDAIDAEGNMYADLYMLQSQYTDMFYARKWASMIADLDRTDEHFRQWHEMLKGYLEAGQISYDEYYAYLSEVADAHYKAQIQNMKNWGTFFLSVLSQIKTRSIPLQLALLAAQTAIQYGQAVASAYLASNLALAHPPGPPETIPLAAATLAQGLANANMILAQAAGTAAGIGINAAQGGAGTISGGGGGGAGIGGTQISEIQEQQPRVINIHFDGGVITDKNFLEDLAEKLSELVEGDEVRLISSDMRAT